MHALRDVVIDETRWPRMFEKLRRAGFFRECSCEHGCRCQLSAKRFLRGLALGAAPELSMAAPRSPRLAAYARNVGQRRVRLLVDRTQQPVVVDVAVSMALADGEVWEGEVPRVQRCDRTWNWIWLTDSRNGRSARNQAIARVATAVPAIASGWCGAANWTNFRSHVPPTARGLYLIRWPDGPVEGAYLGRSHEGSGRILTRLNSHYENWRHFRLVSTPGAARPEDVKIYWLPVNTGSINDVEDRALTGILQAGGYQLNGQPRQYRPRRAERQRAYRAMGFGNLDELETNANAAE